MRWSYLISLVCNVAMDGTKCRGTHCIGDRRARVSANAFDVPGARAWHEICTLQVMEIIFTSATRAPHPGGPPRVSRTGNCTLL